MRRRCSPAWDFRDTLFVQAITHVEGRDQFLWRLVDGTTSTLEVRIGDVEFRRCLNADCQKSFEGDRCPYCRKQFDRIATTRELRPNWVFATRIENWSQYESDWLIECDGAGRGCGFWFSPDQVGSPCRGCHQLRRANIPERCPGCAGQLDHLKSSCRRCRGNPFALIEGARSVWVKTVLKRPRSIDEEE
jgi:hypothetical protein